MGRAGRKQMSPDVAGLELKALHANFKLCH
jgi:hypothetical protein